MTDTINWGILATGGIAGAFAGDLALLPDARVAAVGSRTLDAARRFADRYDIPRAHGDWDSLIADPDVDVIYVANTHNAHFEAARRCLEGGKPVLVEKAFTVSEAEATALVELARARGLFLMEAMWMRCNPAILRMCELIAEGAIGEVTVVNADFGLAGPFERRHRLRDPEQAGGALLDLGVYPVSFAQLVLGRPATIAAVGGLTPEGVDFSTAMAFGYESGAVASLSCSIQADAPVQAAVSGPAGRIQLAAPFFRPDRLSIHRGEADADVTVVEVPVTGIGLAHEAVEVMRCLREGLTQSPLVPWQATLDVMATLDAVRAQIGVRYPGEA